MMRNHFNASVAVGSDICGFDNATLKCIRAESGEEQWTSPTLASGRVFLRNQKEIVYLDLRGDRTGSLAESTTH